MNCFNNNVPDLSASERTRNVKVRNIYKATREDYQTRGKCTNFNGKIGFYKQSGQLRNTNSYESFLNLNRGYALCVDGAADPIENSLYDLSGQSIYRGLASCSKHGKINTVRVKLVNGRDSIFNLFNGANMDPRAMFAGSQHLTGFLYGFPVIKTFPDPSGDCNTWDPLQPFAQYDGSWNILNYPLKNADGCGVVIDPSNILFGTDFCPADIDNRTQGPNKYLTFSQTTSIVLATGQLFDSEGNIITCDLSRNYIQPGMIVMGGVGGATGSITTTAWFPGTPGVPTWRQVFAANFMTSWGIIERACCGTGPNGEPNWWEIYVKPSIGQLTPQEELPITAHIPQTGDPNEIWATIAGKSGSIGGKKVEWGGIWKYGTYPGLPAYSFTGEQLITNFGKNPGGGGLAIFDSVAVLRGIASSNDDPAAPGYPPRATMGWRRRPSVHPPWVLGPVAAGGILHLMAAFAEGEDGAWIMEPYLVIAGVGSCNKNLLFGNNTKQNYLVSYDPKSKNVRFNVNDKILRKYSI